MRYNTNVANPIVLFTFVNRDGNVIGNSVAPVSAGSGTATGYLFCSSLVGTYRVEWTAYRDSTLASVIGFARSSEIISVTC